jgi:hypothetical protein
MLEIWLRSLAWKEKSHTHTPMSTSIKIDLDYIGKYVDSTFYRSMIRSLLYISTGRPHIAFSVGVCARF